MTVIDALVVVLGLDAKELESKSPAAVKKLNELDKGAEKTEKSVGKISKTSKETARSVEGLSRTVTSFLAIIGGTVAIKSFVQDFIDTNAQLDRLSKNLGVSVSTISAWSNATEKFGGSAQGLQGTFDMLSKSQTQLMLTGESSLIPYLSALGISLAGVDGQARPVTDILLDLADRFSHMNRTTANNFGRMLGIDQGTMNLLLQGRKELELEIKRQKEQNAVTAAQAAQAQKFQTQIAGLKQQFAALGRTLLMDAAPSIEKFLGYLEHFAQWAQEHQQFIEDFLKVLAVGIGAIALAALPLNLTLVAVLALAAGIALLWEDYQVWKKGGDTLIDWGKWEPGVEKALWALGELRRGLWFLTQGFKEIAAFKNFDMLEFKRLVLESPPDVNSVANSKFGQSARNIFKRDPNGLQSFFVSQGWSQAQAAGIAANLMSESSGNPNAKGDGGKAFGLAQWHSDRQAEFKKIFGNDIQNSDIGQQLAFVQYELTMGNYKGVGKQLRGTNDAGLAASLISRGYERPKDADGEAQRRAQLAQSYYGIPGAAQIVQNAPSASGGATTIDKSIKVDIASMPIHTQATDAAGIVADMGRALDYLFVSQANYGLVP